VSARDLTLLLCASTLAATALAGCSDGETLRVTASAGAGDAGADAAEVAPPPTPTVRTMVQRGLFGTARPTSLLIDPTFDQGSPGIGRWLVNGGAAPPAVMQQAILSDAPTGVGMTAGVAEDDPGVGGAIGAISFVTQVPGGAGPFRVGLWLSVDPRENQPTPTSLVRVSFAQAWADKGTPSTLDVPLVAEATRTIGARTWYRFEAQAPGPNPIGSLMTIRLRASTYRWYLLAPEVTPLALEAGADTTTKSLTAVHLRVADDEELALYRAYRDQPVPRVPPSQLPKRTRGLP
jgi:hypothetical protein